MFHLLTTEQIKQQIQNMTDWLSATGLEKLTASKR